MGVLSPLDISLLSRKKCNVVAGLFGPKHLSAAPVTGYTWIMKWEAEEDFDRVRFHALNFTDVEVSDLKMVCGSTETDGVSSSANRSHVVVGGSSITSLGADESQNGWKPVTWGGLSTGIIPVRKGGSSAYRPGVVTSEFTGCQSVARADGGTRPLLIFRAYSAGTLTTFSQLLTDVAGGGFNSGTLYAWNSAAAQAASWYRSRRAALTASAVDGVADLTQVGSAQNSGVAIIPEFVYRRRGLTVLGIGDSLLGLADTGKYGTAGHRACAAMQANGVPSHYINYGSPGELSAVFQNPGIEAMTTYRPDIVLHHLYSPNDGVPNAIRNAMALGRLRAVLARANELGITVVVRGATPVSTWNATATAFLDTLNASALAIANTGACLFADLSSLTTGASPNRITPALTPDGTHLNDAGLDLEASIYTALFLAASRY